MAPADLMMLWPEDRGWPEDIGAVVILDPPGDGTLDVGAVLSVVAARLALVPRLRQVLHRPAAGLGGPYWADDERFDVARHVRCATLLPGAGEDDLLAEVERIRRRPFDPAHPRWELWLLPELADGGIGLYLKLHHAVADGLAGIALIGAFLDVDPDAPAGSEEPWIPHPAPTVADLRADARRRRRDGGRELASVLAHPVASMRRAKASGAGLAAIVRARAPRTGLNRPIGPDRRLSLLRLDLEAVRAVGHEHQGTVNDVLLALAAVGFRALLADRGEAVEDLVLRAMVPVSLHEEADSASGNRDGSMLVPLPLGTCTLAARIEAVASATRRAKRSIFVPPAGVVASSGWAQRSTWRRFDRQRWTNAYVADVPGPPVPLHLAGCRLREAFPVVPLAGNIAVGVGALSYAGVLGVAVVSDVDACPDVEVLVSAVAAAAAELGTAAAGPR